MMDWQQHQQQLQQRYKLLFIWYPCTWYWSITSITVLLLLLLLPVNTMVLPNNPLFVQQQQQHTQNPPYPVSSSSSSSSQLLYDRSQFFHKCSFVCTIATTTTTTVVSVLPLPSISSSSLSSSSSAATTTTIGTSKSSHEINNTDNISMNIQHPFVYNTEWTGTNLGKQRDLATAISDITTIPFQQTNTTTTINEPYWVMGKWPDPILRQAADPVNISYFNENNNIIILQQACTILRNTAIREGAVGLAAQQCGINARIIYIQLPKEQQQQRRRRRRNVNFDSDSICMINPKIVQRSSEIQMQIWNESCLVFPPTFSATVLRDVWVDVQYYDVTSRSEQYIRLSDELSRCLQHEMDHDRGILITDHISYDEMETDLMRMIEQQQQQPYDHEQRMKIAYTRYINN